MKKFLLSTLAIVSLATFSFAQIAIIPSNNAANLAQSLAGNGVTISNAVLSSGTNGAGSFTANPNTGLGIASGVVLSTGNVGNIPQAASVFSSTGNGGPTDADLSTLSSNPIDDAARLTFSVTPLGNKLTFRYVFASEEYPEYVCSNFNDVFGFFITGANPNGPNYNNLNLATIPNTNIPVGINSINPGVPGQFGTATQCVSTAYSSLYRDNSTSTNIVFDGMTVVLTATIDVVPCQTYNLKLAVGDATDDIYDSGVFLEAGSFTSNTATINTAYSHLNYTSTYEGCSSATLTFNFTAPFVGSALFDYTISGSATNGTDYQPLSGSVGVPAGSTSASIDIIPNTDGAAEGPETVIISLFLPCSTQPYATTTVTINDAPNLIASADDNTLCPGQSATLTASGGAVSYSWSPTAGLGSPSSAVTSANPTGDVTYTVTGTTGNCSSTVDIALQRSNLNISGITSSVQCGNSSIDVTVNDGRPGYTYVWNDGPVTEDRLNLGAGAFTITVTDVFNCTTSQTFNIAQPPALIVSGTPTNILCFGGSSGAITTSVSGGSPNYTYVWNDANQQVNRANLAEGTYSVTVTDANGCSGIASFTITEPTEGLDVVPLVSNTSCGNSDGEISLSVTGGTPAYTFAWTNTETTKDISNLAAGIYQVTITDANGCTNIQQFTVGSSAQFTITAVPTNETCLGTANGSINVTVSGQTTGIVTYLWNDNVQTEDRSGLSFGSYTITVTDGSGCSATAQAVLTQPASIQVNASQTNINCFANNNGSLSLSSLGGNGGFKYLWNDQNTDSVRNGLSAGIYDVTVTDSKGCTTDRTFTITEPSQLTVSIQKTDATCTGQLGSAVVTPTGGTPGYNYSWNPINLQGASVSNLQQGSYSVTVFDSRGCSATQSFNITTPNPIVLAETHVDVTCKGLSNGLIDVSISGGTPAITFGWADNVQTEDRSGLIAGTYTITASDAAGCSASLSVTIAEPADISVSLVNTDVKCFAGNDGTISATVTGGTLQYVYTWSVAGSGSSLSGLTAGTYSVSVTDANSCSPATASITIAEPQTALAVQVAKTDASCDGTTLGTATLTTSGGTPSYTYSWSNPNLSGSSVSNLAAGSYTVTVSDANGCSKVESFTIVTPAAITLSETHTDVSCFGGNNGTIDVTIAGGTPTVNFGWTDNVQTEDRSGLLPGTYTITASDAAGCSASLSITIAEPSELLVSVSKTDVSCFGDSTGTVSASATGGAPQYSFEWNNQFIGASQSGLPAGTYSVTVTDRFLCTATGSAVIGTPAQLSATVAKTNVKCNAVNDGTADITVTGGAPQYIFTWNVGGIGGGSKTGLAAGNYDVTITDANACTTLVNFIIEEDSAIVLTSSSTPVSCANNADGSASVSATGGSGAYTYVWSIPSQSSSSVTGLTSGSYTVTVTDSKGCSAVENILVGQPIAIQITETHVDVACGNATNGSINITATGGNGGFSFAWQDGGVITEDRSGLGIGTYTVLVTDSKGCSASLAVTIGSNAQAIVITEVLRDVTCGGAKDGLIDVSASGGAGQFSYAWADGNVFTQDRTGLSGGTYTLVVTDGAGCTAQKSFTINESPALSAIATSINAGCTGTNDGSIDLTFTGGTPNISFLWNDQVITEDRSNLASGTYIVTITDSKQCTFSLTVNIGQVSSIQLSQQSTDAKCNGSADGTAAITATGGNGNYAYNWNNPNINGSGSTNLTAGTYNVVVVDGSGCSATTSFSITQPAAIVMNASATPNICFGLGDGTATLAASGGIAPYNFTVELANSNNPNNRLDGNFLGLSAGNYIAKITDKNACVATSTFSIVSANEDLFNWNTSRTSCFGEGFKDGSINAEALTVSNAPFEYSFQGSAFTTQTKYDSLAGGTYVFTTKNSNSCIVNHQVTIQQPAEISVTFPVETLFVEMGHTTQLNANVLNTNGVTFAWTADKSPSYLDFNCTTCTEQSPVSTTPFTNVYRLTVSDTANSQCFKQGAITVVVANEIAVPTAFTPNADGSNDRFYPVFNNKEVKLLEFQVYNRWGQMIHAQSAEGWDGSFNSNAQPIGTYLYYITYERLNVNTGEVEVKKKDGNFTLMR